MNNPLIDSLIPNLDSTLGVRDSIGAVLHKVGIIVRTWSGKKPGDGQASDVLSAISPTPGLKEFTHDVRLLEGGAVKQGDIIVRGISKHRYPTEDLVDCSSLLRNVERFYLIDERLYTVINVKEGYVTWDVQVRKYSNQIRYGGGNL